MVVDKVYEGVDVRCDSCSRPFWWPFDLLSLRCVLILCDGDDANLDIFDIHLALVGSVWSIVLWCFIALSACSLPFSTVRKKSIF